MRILVVESDPVTADVLENAFPKEHEVVVMGSGRAALERIAIGRPFDAVFCEVDPPDMTAKELWTRLTEGSPRTAQRLIFLVAELKTQRAFLEKPPKRYLTRPVTAAGLRDALAALP
jgi:two-component system NtrC family sensor kinase